MHLNMFTINDYFIMALYWTFVWICLNYSFELNLNYITTSFHIALQQIWYSRYTLLASNTTPNLNKLQPI